MTAPAVAPSAEPGTFIAVHEHKYGYDAFLVRAVGTVDEVRAAMIRDRPDHYELWAGEYLNVTDVGTRFTDLGDVRGTPTDIGYWDVLYTVDGEANARTVAASTKEEAVEMVRSEADSGVFAVVSIEAKNEEE